MTSIIKVDQIQNAAGTSGLSIDSNGVVTKSVVPAWRVSLTSDNLRTSTSQETIPFDKTTVENCFLNGGVTISSGVITVPVSGIYQINANIRVDAVGTGYVVANIIVNDQTADSHDTYMLEGSPPSNYTTIHGVDIYKLQANDTIKVAAVTSADTSWDVQKNSTFSGTMIG